MSKLPNLVVYNTMLKGMGDRRPSNVEDKAFSDEVLKEIRLQKYVLRKILLFLGHHEASATHH